MIKFLRNLANRSLAARMMFGFASCVALIWIGLMTWAVISAMNGGRDEVSRELETYSRQVMSVVRVFADNPEKIAAAIASVEKIEREPDMPGDDPDVFHIQVWSNDSVVYSDGVLPGDAPATSGFETVSSGETKWWTYTQVDPATGTRVRLNIEANSTAALSWPDIVTFFIPLITSLPLLLIPAWFMTRFGLRPLNKTANQIGERVESDQLTPLPLTNYRELDPVVEATNRLMSRLDLQLQRERGFVADVAHEMKTPLAIVQTNLGILENSEHPERRKTALQDLKSGIGRSNHLIQQLLRMARLDSELDETAVRREMDLSEFVRERIAQAATLARRKNILIELQAPETCLARIDADAIAAILDNLVDNAIKYSPQGTSIKVSLTELKSTDGLSQAQISVQDQGPGIRESDRIPAFERFQRLAERAEVSADNQSGGAGLGLSIVSRATARLGGTIQLQSAPNGPGLLAVVTLPLSTE